MMYEYWLAAVKNISSHKKKALREVYGNARQLFYIEETELLSGGIINKEEVSAIKCERDEAVLKTRYEKLTESGIRFVPYFAHDYPEKLKEIQDPPYALYVKGSLPDEDIPCAAIVGARKCTRYGEEMALLYGEVLAENGIQIISGMARGIDGAGQRGALMGEGKTFAVLGCGADICYPREHQGLYMDIQKNGGILSELPPGSPPLGFHFPRRNRIISGLSDIVLVMEAKERSGSLITADLAMEQGRDVYALPGPVTSSLSMGCHRLIRQGAGILLSPQDLLEEMKIQYRVLCKKEDKNKKMLESQEQLVYSCLGLFPKSVSQLAEETRIAPGKLLGSLAALEIEGQVREVSKNYYIKVRK